MYNHKVHEEYQVNSLIFLNFVGFVFFVVKNLDSLSNASLWGTRD